MNNTTPTDAQIIALKNEAGSAGDSETVQACEAALSGDAEALAAVERVISDARAMWDEVLEGETDDCLNWCFL
jgi:hypothetical protein